MAVESIRGCGYRNVGSLYVVGDGLSLPCPEIPYWLDECPVCGGGVKFSRNWTRIPWPRKLFNRANDCPHALKPEKEKKGVSWKCGLIKKLPGPCPFNQDDPAWLLWVGKRFYSPKSFTLEAERLGVSRKIPTIPRGFEVGKTWVLLAHKEAVPQKLDAGRTIKLPGIFYAFRPQRIEMLVYASDLTDQLRDRLAKRGITPVMIPDGDKDHAPSRQYKKRIAEIMKAEDEFNDTSLDDFKAKKNRGDKPGGSSRKKQKKPDSSSRNSVKRNKKGAKK